ARATSQSITEQHSALDDNAIAGRDAARDKCLLALLELDIHGAWLELPRRGLDIDLRRVVLQHQRAGRRNRKLLIFGVERRGREHAWTQQTIAVLEGDTHLDPTRGGVEHIAHEQ